MYFRYSKPTMVGLIAFGCIFMLVGTVSYFFFPLLSGRFFQSAGYMLTTAGIFQLDVSGFFEHVKKVYGDQEKYPYGPPSYLTRMITDAPHNRLIRKIWEYFTFNQRAAVHLFLAGNILGLIGTWI
jgi:hypothetical protein